MNRGPAKQAELEAAFTRKYGDLSQAKLSAREERALYVATVATVILTGREYSQSLAETAKNGGC